MSIIRYLLFGVLLFGTGLFFFVAGMQSNDSEIIRNFFRAIKYGEYGEIIAMPSKFLGNKSVTPKKLELFIEKEDNQKLIMYRNRALDEKRIHEENKQYVKAKIVSNGDTVIAKIRIKGGGIDHIITDKWSFRIKVKKKKRILGMKNFSIQAPETRKMLNEWLMFEFFKEEGLIALNYDFVQVEINGEIKGIYALEESFEEQLLVNNNRAVTPIIKFEGDIWVDGSLTSLGQTDGQTDVFYLSEIDCFEGKKTFKNLTKRNYFVKAYGNMRRFISGEKLAHEVIDVEQFAKLYAISEVLCSYHALRWKNFRGYFNPTTELIEPIAFDGNSGSMINELYYKAWYNNRIGDIDYGEMAWKNLFFSNIIFLEHYFNYLRKYSDKKFLDSFFEKKETLINNKLGILYNDSPDYIFLTNIYYHNADIIQKSFTSQKQKPHLNINLKEVLDVASGNKVIFQIANTTFFPVEVIDLVINGRPVSNKEAFVIDGKLENAPLKYISFEFLLNGKLKKELTPKKKFLKNLKLRYRAVGSSDTLLVSVKSFGL